MPLLSKTRKLQSGASLNQAKNEPAITDVRWKQFDVSGYKHTPLDINSAMMDQGANGRAGSKSGASGGLPSDIAYVNDQLKKYRNNLKMGLSGSNAKEYGESAQAKEDSDQVVKWSEKLTMLKSREDNYKANSLRLGKSTTDDYAIFGGKALAKDNSAAGAFVIVDAQDLLTKRTKDAKGKTTNQYTPATIGEALAVRLDDPNFSGFNDNGGILDNILASAQDASSVEKEMDSMFTRVGSVNETADTFVSNQTGNASSLTELIKTLEDANKVHSTGVTIKTNQPNLLGAVQLFKNNIGPAQLEALRGKAIAKFLSEYGSQDIKNPASVAEWIEAKLDSDITERALVFLKKSQNKSKTASGATSTADALSKKETGMNLITAIQMGGSTGHKVTLSTNSYKDADDLKKRMDLLVSVGAEGLDIVPAVRGTGTKEDPNTLETNPFIRTLTRGELRTNLFLGDHDSTPVANLAKQNGLKLAAINTTSYGQNMQVLRNMPYTEVDGRKKIAWDYVEKAIEFGKEFSKREQKVLETTKRPYLSKDEIKAIQSKMDDEGLGFTKNPEIKTGDIAMIPIIVYDTDKTYDDPDLDSFMQSGVSGEEAALIPDVKNWFPDWLTSGAKKRTFAFTVLPSDYESTRKEAYGPAMEMKDKVNMLDFLNSRKVGQALSNSSYNIINTVIESAASNPTK